MDVILTRLDAEPKNRLCDWAKVGDVFGQAVAKKEPQFCAS